MLLANLRSIVPVGFEGRSNLHVVFNQATTILREASCSKMSVLKPWPLCQRKGTLHTLYGYLAASVVSTSACYAGTRAPCHCAAASPFEVWPPPQCPLCLRKTNSHPIVVLQPAPLKDYLAQTPRPVPDRRASRFGRVNEMHAIAYQIVAGRRSKNLPSERMVTSIYL